jgi:UDP:flavonoid glycosyltransferase YjiC (YdhE family)
MKIALATTGSTGDLMPFVWLAERLTSAGVAVRAISHPHYEPFFKSGAIPFSPAGPPLDLAHLDQVRERLTSTRNPIALMNLVLDEVTLKAPEAHYADCLRAFEGCDLVVAHHLYFAAQEAAIEAGVPWIGVILMPNMLESDYHPPSHEAPLSKLRMANRVWWRLAHRLASGPNDRLRKTLRGLSGRTRAVSFFGGLSQLNLLAASPAVSTIPPEVSRNIYVTGAWLPAPPQQPVLSSNLEAFLGSGEPPVLVSLGSAGYSADSKTAEILLRSLSLVGCRALIYAGPESQFAPRDHHDSALFIGFVPFEALLPRICVVVHHGGAGTTAFACRAGIPSVVIPHFADHFYWAAALYERGVSPRPIPRRRLTVDRLANTLHAVLESAKYRRAARRVSEQMARENGLESASREIISCGVAGNQSGVSGVATSLAQ